MTKRKRYKRYSAEFKREALKRASEEGVTDVIVCEELGVNLAAHLPPRPQDLLRSGRSYGRVEALKLADFYLIQCSMIAHGRQSADRSFTALPRDMVDRPEKRATERDGMSKCE